MTKTKSESHTPVTSETLTNAIKEGEKILATMQPGQTLAYQDVQLIRGFVAATVQTLRARSGGRLNTASMTVEQWKTARYQIARLLGQEYMTPTAGELHSAERILEAGIHIDDPKVLGL